MRKIKAKVPEENIISVFSFSCSISLSILVVALLAAVLVDPASQMVVMMDYPQLNWRTKAHHGMAKLAVSNGHSACGQIGGLDCGHHYRKSWRQADKRSQWKISRHVLGHSLRWTALGWPPIPLSQANQKVIKSYINHVNLIALIALQLQRQLVNKIVHIEYKLNLHYIHSPNHLNLLRLHIDLVRLNDSIKDFFLDSVCFRPHFYKKHYYYFYSITLLPGALMTLCLFSLPTFEFYEAHATFRRVKQEKKRTNHSTLQQNLKAPIKNYFYFSLHSHAFVEWDLHFSCLFFNLTWLFALFVHLFSIYERFKNVIVVKSIWSILNKIIIILVLLLTMKLSKAILLKC